MEKNFVLKKGDLVHFKNSGTVTVNGWEGETIKYLEDYFGKVLKVERPTGYETVYELEEILDKEEKEYLRAVIKPFRHRVESISKWGGEKQSISIYFKDIDRSISLPDFAPNTMYKGMETYREYTLEELGL